MEAKIISFAKVKDEQLKAAYDWAVSEQKRLGITARTLNLEIVDEESIHDNNKCIFSIYADEKTDTYIFRRDWFDKNCVDYHMLGNFQELRNTAPLSVQHLLDNGVKVYRFFDGQNGGVTRPTDKQWQYA